MVFVDLQKAYDSVPRSKLWVALDESGVEQDIIVGIKGIYHHDTTGICSGGLISGPIKITKGLRQGCSISPILFNIYVMWALRNWKRRIATMGIPVDQHLIYYLHSPVRGRPSNPSSGPTRLEIYDEAPS